MLIWPCSGLEPDTDRFKPEHELVAKKVTEGDDTNRAMIAAAAG